MKLRRCILIALFMVVCSGLYAQTDGEERRLWENPRGISVSDSEIAFSHTNYRPSKNESTFILGYFNDGWVFMFSLFHLKNTLFNRWGMYALVAEPSGKSYWYTYEPKRRDMEIREDALFVSDGKSFLEGRGNRYRLVADFEGFTCDLELKGYVQPWRPGSGRVYYTPDKKLFQEKQVYVPWGEISGFITLDGKRVDVEGFTTAEKTLFVNPLMRHQPVLHALRLYSPFDAPYNDRWHIALLDATLNRAYGFKKVPRLILMRGDKWVFTTQDYTLEQLETVVPDYVSYEYPTRLSLFARAQGYLLQGEFREETFFLYTDVFDELPDLIRNIFIAFFKRPVYFRYVAAFEGTITEPNGTVHQVRLKGPYEYVLVN